MSFCTAPKSGRRTSKAAGIDEGGAVISEIYQTNGDNGLWVFLLITLLLGGAAAYATGRAVASTWRPLWHAIAYALLLGAVARFLQYALFEQPFLSATNYAVDAAMLILFVLVGYRNTRAQQMTSQYPWAIESGGLFGWRQRDTEAQTDKIGHPTP
jgi:hypothetical protein